MSSAVDFGWSVVKRIANICAIAALFPLIAAAEWVPDLLPRSPNLAFSANPRISSIAFPVIATGVASLGFVAWYLLRRLNRFGPLSFGAFWLSLYVSFFLIASAPARLDFAAIIATVTLLAFPLFLTRSLLLNWPLALRSNNSLERTREP